MTTYLLDANVLVDFQAAGALPSLAAAAERCELALAEQVYDELTLETPDDTPTRVGSKRHAASVLAGSKLRSLQVTPGTAQERLLRALLAPIASVSKKDQGEAASVALASGDPSLVFVTGDRVAALWALNELWGTGERVLRVPSFVRLLYERDALPSSAVLVVASRAASHGVVPTWWERWLAGLAR